MTDFRAVKPFAVALVAAALLMAGCSSQDFGRPVGQYGDVVDPGVAYVDDGAEEDALARAERLAKVLMAWEEQKRGEDKDYFVGSDDILDIGIMSIDTPGEISTFERTISKQGLITLPLVGDIKTAGLSSRELEKRIAAAYDGGYLKDPQVTVTVKEYRSAPIFVTGVVGSPGVYYLTHNQSSVLEILPLAGGLATGAGDVLHIIRRPDPESKDAPEAPGEDSAAAPGEGHAATQPADAAGLSTATPPEDPEEDVVETPVEAPATNMQELVADVTPAADAGTNEVFAAASTGEEAPKKTRGFFARLFGRSNGEDSEASPEDSEEDAAVDVSDIDDVAAAAPAEQMSDEEVTAENDPELSVEIDSAVQDLAALSGLKSPFDGEPEIISVDLSELLDEGDIRLNVPIYSGDIISVPPGREEYIYVQGYVQSPGAFSLQGKKEIQALQAVAMAGGLSGSARAQNSVLIRTGARTREVVEVDLTKIVRGTRPAVYMQAGDILIVGSGFFAKLAEFIRPTVSASAGASLTPVP